LSGIELFALQMARRVREHNEEVDRINAENERLHPMSVNTTNTVTLPKTPKNPKSTTVISALVFLSAAFVLAALACTFALPYLAVFAVVDGLAAVTLAILSLRETA
jgi:hypothetical protein